METETPDAIAKEFDLRMKRAICNHKTLVNWLWHIKEELYKKELMVEGRVLPEKLQRQCENIKIRIKKMEQRALDFEKEIEVLKG